MEAKYLHEGKAIDYTPDADITAGRVIPIGDLIGITHRDIAAGQLGSLNLQGVYEVVKETGLDTNISLGSKVYWNLVEAVASKSSSSGLYMGKAVKAAGNSDATVLVKLDQ